MRDIKIDFDHKFDNEISINMSSLIQLYLRSYLDCMKDDSFFYKNNSEESSQREDIIRKHKNGLQIVQDGRFDLQFIISQHN